jgi:hypothetical protein
MKVTRKSMFTGKENTLDLDITQEQLIRYETGSEVIQRVFPRLSADEREFIKTGVTPEEWNATFGGAE